jgi:hypothetical protein
VQSSQFKPQYHKRKRKKKAMPDVWLKVIERNEILLQRMLTVFLIQVDHAVESSFLWDLKALSWILFLFIIKTKAGECGNKKFQA